MKNLRNTLIAFTLIFGTAYSLISSASIMTITLSSLNEVDAFCSSHSCISVTRNKSYFYESASYLVTYEMFEPAQCLKCDGDDV